MDKRSPHTPLQHSDAELYRMAARQVEERNIASCCAVTYLVSSSIPPINCAEALRYVYIFADGMMEYGRMVGGVEAEERQAFRETALCFAAAMVETGDA